MKSDIIIRLQQAEHSAINELYDTYSGALYNLILRIVPESDLAEQILQDTFVKAWRNGRQYDPSKGRIFTWLMSIARHTAIDAQRSTRFRYILQTENLEDQVNLTSKDMVNTDNTDLLKLMDRLGEKYRTLLEMVYFQGFTQEEVAHLCNIPLGTVKTRVRHAMMEMRKIYALWNPAAGYNPQRIPKVAQEMHHGHVEEKISHKVPGN